MLQVHRSVAAVGDGFDAGAEEGRRTCSIDPRTQPVLTLRQRSLQSVAVCPPSVYNRIGPTSGLSPCLSATPGLYTCRLIARLLFPYCFSHLVGFLEGRYLPFDSSLLGGNFYRFEHMDCEARGMIEASA